MDSFAQHRSHFPSFWPLHQFLWPFRDHFSQVTLKYELYTRGKNFLIQPIIRCTLNSIYERNCQESTSCPQRFHLDILHKSEVEFLDSTKPSTFCLFRPECAVESQHLSSSFQSLFSHGTHQTFFGLWFLRCSFFCYFIKIVGNYV